MCEVQYLLRRLIIGPPICAISICVILSPILYSVVEDVGGEGIGLANVRALAYRLGGRISVASELGKGSRFTLILPQKFIVETAS